MNALILGSHKEPILNHLPDQYLFIDDGTLIDKLTIPERKKVTIFDPEAHSFNPLKDIDYRKACEFVNVLDAIFPEGADTLTKRYSNFIILRELLNKPKSLDTLIEQSKETMDAYQKIQTLLLSPVLERVLNHKTNMSFKGTIIARLDRAVLGDFDCFVLANLLISQYAGPVVIPDFGFYACKFHTSLIRQNRLIAGLNYFDEVPSFKSQLLMIDNKIGSHCTPDDAKLLALYAGHLPGTNAYNDFIDECIHPIT